MAGLNIESIVSFPHDTFQIGSGNSGNHVMASRKQCIAIIRVLSIWKCTKSVFTRCLQTPLKELDAPSDPLIRGEEDLPSLPPH